jgi:hypothetical protein
LVDEVGTATLMLRSLLAIGPGPCTRFMSLQRPRIALPLFASRTSWVIPALACCPQTRRSQPPATGVANLYFHADSLKEGAKNRKTKKDDVDAVLWLHVDVGHEDALDLIERFAAANRPSGVSVRPHGHPSRPRRARGSRGRPARLHRQSHLAGARRLVSSAWPYHRRCGPTHRRAESIGEAYPASMQNGHPHSCAGTKSVSQASLSSGSTLPRAPI